MEKYISATFLTLLVAISSLAQGELNKQPGKESLAYHAYRQKVSVPPYSLEKIKSLIANIKSEEEFPLSTNLSTKVYDNLSLREKFTYNMIHGESFYQICSMPSPIYDEHKKIFGRFMRTELEMAWSERQRNFIKVNRDSVIKLMAACISQSNEAGINFKRAIEDLNAKEMIPLLITTYNVTKMDHDILTVLMLLMKQNKYPPFMASEPYKTLYGPDSRYKSFLPLNKGNEDLIIQLATNFYNGLKH